MYLSQLPHVPYIQATSQEERNNIQCIMHAFTKCQFKLPITIGYVQSKKKNQSMLSKSALFLYTSVWRKWRLMLCMT